MHLKHISLFLGYHNFLNSLQAYFSNHFRCLYQIKKSKTKHLTQLPIHHIFHRQDMLKQQEYTNNSIASTVVYILIQVQYFIDILFTSIYFYNFFITHYGQISFNIRVLPLIFVVLYQHFLLSVTQK